MKLLYFRILQALKFNGFIYLEIGFTESVGIGDFQHITDLPYIPQNKTILFINAAQETFVLETRPHCWKVQIIGNQMILIMNSFGDLHVWAPNMRPDLFPGS